MRTSVERCYLIIEEHMIMNYLFYSSVGDETTQMFYEATLFDDWYLLFKSAYYENFKYKRVRIVLITY
jgi:hypothetical protein